MVAFYSQRLLPMPFNAVRVGPIAFQGPGISFFIRRIALCICFRQRILITVFWGSSEDIVVILRGAAMSHIWNPKRLTSDAVLPIVQKRSQLKRAEHNILAK
jgi:hypothetical protein